MSNKIRKQTILEMFMVLNDVIHEMPIGAEIMSGMLRAKLVLRKHFDEKDNISYHNVYYKSSLRNQTDKKVVK